ncbi:MAG: VWA domain-containing protein [Terriglobales bacterium]
MAVATTRARTSSAGASLACFSLLARIAVARIAERVANSRLVRVAALSALLAGLRAPAAWAQGVSKFSATRRVVQVEARVSDGRASPLPGIDPDQFRLYVDGLACPRLLVDWVQAGSSQVRGNLPVDHLAWGGVYPQSADIGLLAPSRIVLLYDFVNTAPIDRMRLLAAMRHLLANSALFGSEVELVRLLPPIEILQAFTTDQNTLREQLARIDPLAGGPAPPRGFQYDPALVEAGPLGDAARRQLAFFDHMRSEATLAGFRWLSRELQALSGTKIIIWLTADASALNPSFEFQFAMDPAERPVGIPRSELEWTFRLLNKADVTIWPLELRGVANPGLINAASASPGGSVDKLRQLQEDRAGDARLAMFTVAKATGGFVFEGDNDITDLLRRALALAHGYYVLTCPFTLAASALHGHELRGGHLLLAPGYHSLKIHVSRRGARVLARQGVEIGEQ